LQLHKDQKVTFLLSSHILPELSRVCDSLTIINEGKVYVSGKLSELYEKFTARVIRVSTDKPAELAEVMKGLTYLEKVETNSQGVSVKIGKEASDTVYEDIPRLARLVQAKILGIETASVSLEELYRQVVDSGGP
jgi:ABC-2 type transport system ATP-binding protein